MVSIQVDPVADTRVDPMVNIQVVEVDTLKVSIQEAVNFNNPL